MARITRSFLRDRFLSIDVRTLAFTRVAIALMLFYDLGRRVAEFSVWYSDAGLLPSALVEAHPIRSWSYSFLDHLNNDTELRIAFAAIGIVYFCFLIGLFTRFFHVLSFVCLTSLQVRLDLLVNGGDFVFSDLVLWTAFLPLGATFSVDAWWKKRRGKPPARSPHVSWAVLVAILQFAVIYFFNGVQKGSTPWLQGTSVYWVVQQERLVTWFGALFRELFPLWVFQILTYSTLLIEYLLPWLIISPWGRPTTRRIAILFILALHLGIAAVANVGLFSFVMISYGTLLVGTEDWDWLARKLEMRRPRLARALTLPPAHAMATPEPSPWRLVTGSLLAFFVVVATWQVLEENNVPKFMKPTQPEWVRNSVMLTRLNQGWKMFATPPRQDMTLVVDAVTADGCHVDPLNEVASRHADPNVRSIPRYLGQNYYWYDYTGRIKTFGAYHSGLTDWIYRYHERTGNDEDRILSFEVYEVTHAMPLPGQDGPTNVKARSFLQGRR